ncbi:MAG: hypothetical protein COT06_09160 [Syntrophobacteraceae bacterium CG07_land_8_20_14_0_80_61_8]|nr:MAG: hypothetical protein COT06_09160 [Syntrophobacteraceae bacterium CG07_land_8_20_14_0_80_61_8]
MRQQSVFESRNGEQQMVNSEMVSQPFRSISRVRYSMVGSEYPPSAVRYSIFDIRYSIFDIRYSIFDIRYSIFDIRYSSFRPCSLVNKRGRSCRTGSTSQHPSITSMPNRTSVMLTPPSWPMS